MESSIDHMHFERYFYPVLSFVILTGVSILLSIFINRNDTDVPWKKVQDNVILPGRLGIRNTKWKIYNDKQSQEDPARLYYKKGHRVQELDEIMLHEVFVSQMHFDRRGVYFISGSGHGKFSYIKNFLCAGLHGEKPICNKIIFYHMCNIESARRSNPIHFIKQISRNIMSVFPEIGYEIYFNTFFEKYLYGDWCSSNPNQCIDKLIAKPLRNYFGKKPFRRYIIVVERLDECVVTGSMKEWNIIRVLHILLEWLPKEVYFILTSSEHKHKFDELKLLTLESIFTVYGNTIRIGPCIEGLTCRNSEDFIGYCFDSTQLFVRLALIWVVSYWQLRSATSKLFITIFSFMFVEFILIITPPVTLVLLIIYWRFELRFKEESKKYITRTEFNTKSWFFKLDIRCDNIDIHCIIDERLERKYSTFGTVLQRNSSGESFMAITSKERLVKLKQNSMCEFELAYTLKNDITLQNKSDLDVLMTKYVQLINATSENQNLLCRWILANLDDTDLTNLYIDEALTIAFSNQDKNTAKALAWVIIRAFYKTHAQMFTTVTVTDLYPALRCSCKGKGTLTKPLCSRDKMLIVATDDYDQAILSFPDVFRNFSVNIFKNSNSRKKGRKEVNNILRELRQIYTDSFCLKIPLSSTTAEDLFFQHSNLGLLCPCAVKSVGFKKRNYQIIHEISIQLYCKKKGVVPIGENHFPEYIGGIMTDVIEGQPELMSNLRIGTKIGPTTSQGTLGGFMQYLDIDCFLTCAHVMYDLQTLIDEDITLLKGSTAYIHSPFGQTEVGKVIWRAFNHSDKSKTSIDAAIVALLNNATIDPNDYVLDPNGVRCHFSQLGLSSQYLNTSCLDYEEFCIPQQLATVVCPGSMTMLQNIIQFNKQRDEDVQFTPTGPTAASVNNNTFFPLWLGQPAHLQLHQGFLQGRRVFRMYNQLALNIPLISGDSGTCIYIVQHPTTNGCIGMAIAVCGTLTLVTPLKEILKRVSTS